MRKNSAYLSVLICVALSVVVVGGAFASGSQEPAEGGAAESYSFDVANALTPEHTHSQALAEFAGELEELTEGRITAEVFNNGQLGGERVAMEQVQLGATAVTRTGHAVLTNLIPEMELFGLPYLFDDVDEMVSALDGELGEYLTTRMREEGLVVLGWFDYGARSVLATRPVRTPEDMAGLRIRVQSSPIEARAFEVFNAAPVNLPFTDLYSALDSGVIDAVENGPDTLYDQRFYEVAGVFSETAHFIQPTPLYMSAQIFDELPSELQEAVKEAGRAAVQFIRDNQPQAVQDGIDSLEAAGTTMVMDVDRDAFQAAAESLYGEFYGEYPELEPILEEIRSN